eukprot:4437477-Alexandrium_andersonii.AAC.1
MAGLGVKLPRGARDLGADASAGRLVHRKIQGQRVRDFDTKAARFKRVRGKRFVKGRVARSFMHSSALYGAQIVGVAPT